MTATAKQPSSPYADWTTRGLRQQLELAQLAFRLAVSQYARRDNMHRIEAIRAELVRRGEVVCA